MVKEFIDASIMYSDAFSLGEKIFDSGFAPDVLIAIWRGGTPIGCCVEEYLRIKEIQTDHFPIKTSAYEGDELKRDIRVEGLETVAKRITQNTKLLIIDDVFDTGNSVAKVIETLKELKGSDFPAISRIATLYYKPGKNQTTLKPDYFIHAKNDDVWLVFPHELEGLSDKQLTAHRPSIASGIIKTPKDNN